MTCLKGGWEKFSFLLLWPSQIPLLQNSLHAKVSYWAPSITCMSFHDFLKNIQRKICSFLMQIITLFCSLFKLWNIVCGRKVQVIINVHVNELLSVEHLSNHYSDWEIWYCQHPRSSLFFANEFPYFPLKINIFLNYNL